MAETSNTQTASLVADEILDSVKIPSLPEAAVRLLTMCRDDFCAAGDLVRIIELDMALSARVLKVANSAAFGQQRRINTLTSAAVVLGNENLKVAALGFYLSTGWQEMDGAGIDVREFWRDAVIRACLGRRLAQCAGYQPREEAFLAGMLLEIGTLILGTHFGEEYALLLRITSGAKRERINAERSRFHIDHVEMAQSLCVRWNFPEAMIGAVGQQCTPPIPQRSSDPAALLAQIAYFCANVPFSVDQQTARVGDELRNLAYGAFELSFEGLSEVFTDAVEQFNALRSVFANLIPHDCNVEVLMEQARNLIAESTTAINE